MSDVWSAGRIRPCPECGALNGQEFARCVRCGAALSAAGKAAEGLRRPLLAGESLAATKLIGGATLLVFVFQVMASLARGQGFPILRADPIDALRFGAFLVAPQWIIEEPWRLASAVFVHFGAVHFVMNFIALMNLSRASEPAVGSARFVVVYVVSGVVGFAITVVGAVVSASPASLTAGASGAVFGVMGLILGWLLRRRDPRWKGFAMQAVFWSVMFGFAVNAANAGVLVNNAAHVGGLATGILIGLFFAGRGPKRNELWANVGAALCLVLCVASLVLAQVSPLWRLAERQLRG
jgi:membrane associated rhomboid family serine protease